MIIESLPVTDMIVFELLFGIVIGTLCLGISLVEYFEDVKKPVGFEKLLEE